MNKNKLNKIVRKIEQLKAGSANVHSKELIRVATKLGRKLDNRGKEPTYVNEYFPKLKPISIPAECARFTKLNVLTQLDDDIFQWYEEIKKSKHNE
jgi:hypothetical protein